MSTNYKLPFSNWSLRKILATEESSFNQAKIKILFLFLLFAIIKSIIVVFVTWHYDQNFQLIRSAIFLVLFIGILKALLINKDYLNSITHIILSLGVFITVSNTFIFSGSINIATLQFVFMIILSSFYLLDLKFSIIYSSLSVLTVISYLVLSNGQSLKLNISTQELVAPAAITIVILNFISILLIHYLYLQAFRMNIAEKETLNHKLEEAVEIANRNAQSKSDFLSTMSHELRTPLNSVIGMTELLLNDSTNAEQKENLNAIKFSASSLHTIINDILDFNKLDSETIELENITVNLNSLMENIFSGFELQAREKGIKLLLQVDDAIKFQNVITDPMRITQIIYNLVGNGLKFTHQGNVSLSLNLVAMSEDSMKILFTIADTGIGIEPDKHKNIFEPFIQASSLTTRHFGGTGLGLAIVKRLLTLFDSEINLESTLGFGSKFYFDINFKVDKQFKTVGPKEVQIETDLSGLRVLVAEDNRMNIFLIKKLGQKWNIELDVVENGIDVLNVLKSKMFDVILMDIHMPIMDGYETTKEIRKLSDKEKSQIPIIALTASVTNELGQKVRLAGMNDYLRKPFNASALYSKLKGISQNIHITYSSKLFE